MSAKPVDLLSFPATEAQRAAQLAELRRLLALRAIVGPQRALLLQKRDAVLAHRI